MIQATTQDIGALIDKLAAKLAIPAAQLWAVLIQQARIEAWRSVVGIAVDVAVAIFAWKAGRALQRWFAKTQDDGDDADSPYLFGSIALGLLGVIAALDCMATINSLFTLLGNPEYYALKQILGALK